MNFAGWPNCFRREITFEGGGSPECQGAWFLDVESPDPSWHGRELGLGPGGAAGADAPAPLASGLSVFGKISAKFRSFSVVSKRICPSKYAFDSIFQNLPDYLAAIFEIWQNLAKFATFAKNC